MWTSTAGCPGPLREVLFIRVGDEDLGSFLGVRRQSSGIGHLVLGAGTL